MTQPSAAEPMVFPGASGVAADDASGLLAPGPSSPSDASSASDASGGPGASGAPAATRRRPRPDGLAAFALRRLLLAVPILLGITLIVFALLQLTPGSPVDALLGPYATAAQRTALKHSLGLDRPMLVQYVLWLRRLLSGNLGQSFSQSASVSSLLIAAVRNTLVLAVFTAVVAIVGGMGLGFVWAKGPRPFRRVASVLTLAAVSTPQYAVALLSIVVIALHVPGLPTTGMYDLGQDGNLVDLARHIVLPGCTASLVMMGIIARILRATLLDVEAAPWVATMRARGMSRSRVNRHVVLNTLPSLLSVVGIQFGYLIGGVLFVEIIFSWPGMGVQVYGAIAAHDYSLVQADVLAGAIGFVAVNLVVDLIVAVIDPRTRTHG